MDSTNGGCQYVMQLLFHGNDRCEKEAEGLNLWKYAFQIEWVSKVFSRLKCILYGNSLSCLFN